ncbi:hypothetical protein OIW09_003628, partial [Acinetobacter baumannii]|nr:hypothetical protein [Acinetobacter baumannii]EKV9407335.1 hypothetical protein [Acinetobacter baumannii]
FLILYSSNMYGDEIYLCNKASIVPADFNVKKEAQTIVENKKSVSEENAKMIVNYFNSEEYQKNNKKINLV